MLSGARAEPRQHQIMFAWTFYSVLSRAEHHWPKYEATLVTESNGHTYDSDLSRNWAQYRGLTLSLSFMRLVVLDAFSAGITCLALKGRGAKLLGGSSLSLLVAEWHQKAERRNAGREREEKCRQGTCAKLLWKGSMLLWKGSIQPEESRCAMSQLPRRPSPCMALPTHRSLCRVGMAKPSSACP